FTGLLNTPEADGDDQHHPDQIVPVPSTNGAVRGDPASVVPCCARDESRAENAQPVQKAGGRPDSRRRGTPRPRIWSRRLDRSCRPKYRSSSDSPAGAIPVGGGGALSRKTGAW